MNFKIKYLLSKYMKTLLKGFTKTYEVNFIFIYVIKKILAYNMTEKFYKQKYCHGSIVISKL